MKSAGPNFGKACQNLEKRGKMLKKKISGLPLGEDRLFNL